MFRYDKPRAIAEVIESLVGRLGIQKELDEASIIEAWAVLAGPEINAATEGAWIRGGKLYVKITSSVRRQQLHMRRTLLRDRLNQAVGKDVVREIVFR
jgi:predicted nucleic acid-binding Zn ribbon protein